MHLSSLLKLSRHTHVKIVLWPAVLIKHINVEPKNTRNYEKVIRTTREESIFHVGNQVPKFEWGVPKFDEGPPWGPEPLEKRTIDQAMPYFQTIHSL